MNTEDGLRELGYKPEALRGNPLAEPLGNMGLLQKQALEAIAARDARIAELESAFQETYHALEHIRDQAEVARDERDPRESCELIVKRADEQLSRYESLILRLRGGPQGNGGET